MGAVSTTSLRPASGEARRAAEVVARLRALRSVCAVGVGWGALSIGLWRMGHTPAVDTGPLPLDAWYLWQGCLLPVLLPLLFSVHAWITERVVARGGLDWSRLARAYAGSVGLVLVLPESVALWWGGVDALKDVAPVSGMMLPWVAWCATGVALRRDVGLEMRSALARCLPGLMAQTALGAILLR